MSYTTADALTESLIIELNEMIELAYFTGYEDATNMPPGMKHSRVMGAAFEAFKEVRTDYEEDVYATVFRTVRELEKEWGCEE